MKPATEAESKELRQGDYELVQERGSSFDRVRNRQSVEETEGWTLSAELNLCFLDHLHVLFCCYPLVISKIH